LDTRVRSCAATRTPAGAEASREILNALSIICRWIRLDGECQDICGTASGVHTADADGNAAQSDIGVSLFPGAGTSVFLSWKSRTGSFKPRRGVEAQSRVSGNACLFGGSRGCERRHAIRWVGSRSDSRSRAGVFGQALARQLSHDGQRSEDETDAGAGSARSLNDCYAGPTKPIVTPHARS